MMVGSSPPLRLFDSDVLSFVLSATLTVLWMSRQRDRKQKGEAGFATWQQLLLDDEIKNDQGEERTEKLVKHRVMQMRGRHFSPRLSVSYANSDPLMIMEGRGSRLYDESGVSYLDTRNNVAHCGHCHPRIVQAVQQQVAMLNTNTRYLHPNMALLGQRLLSKFPEPLASTGKVFFCNSGSEANDLALRLARAFNKDGSSNTIVVEGAYHGHTLAALEVSPYKFLKGSEYAAQLREQHTEQDSSTQQTPGPHIWQVPMPDAHRGRHSDCDPDTAGALYAGYVEKACQHYQTEKKESVRAFIMEGGLSVGGVILPPRGYLKRCAAAVRAAGGVYIADEVQTGFGRLGHCFWAFEYQHEKDDEEDAPVPDIVTMGKPMGNGMPLAAVVCTQQVAQAFDEKGVEYFNTFAGNPVSAVAGLTLLDVVEEEGLQQHALEVGNYMKAEFVKIQKAPETFGIQLISIGSVRGSGLFLGLELVKPDSAKFEPATAETSFLCSVLRQKYHILTSIDGIHDNIFVIKPPMVFSKDDVDCFVQAFVTACQCDLPRAGDLSQVDSTPT